MTETEAVNQSWQEALALVKSVGGNALYLTMSASKVPVDTASGQVAGDTIEAQAEQCCRNLAAILEAAGTDFAHVVKTTCFLADMKDFAAFNTVYAKYFVSKPARSCVAVRELPKSLLCEIEAVAALGE